MKTSIRESKKEGPMDGRDFYPGPIQSPGGVFAGGFPPASVGVNSGEDKGSLALFNEIVIHYKIQRTTDV